MDYTGSSRFMGTIQGGSGDYKTPQGQMIYVITNPQLYLPFPPDLTRWV